MNKNSKMPGKCMSEYLLLWTNLSRLNGTLLIANLSLFFVSRLVIEKGYYYTFYSLFSLSVVEIAGVVPHRLFHGLWFYLMILTFEAFALCFLVASAWYLIDMSRVPLLKSMGR
jgi:hypothetical protein